MKEVKINREDIETGMELAQARSKKPNKSMRKYAEATVGYMWDGTHDDGIEYVMNKDQHINNAEWLMQMGAVEAGGENLAKGAVIGAGAVGLAWLGLHLYNKRKRKMEMRSEFEKLYREHVEKYEE